MLFVRFGSSIVATFNYSVRLMGVAPGHVRISLATYLLPTLAGLAAAKNTPSSPTLGQGLSYLLSPPDRSAFLGAGRPIVRLIFEHGKFRADATQRVACRCLPGARLLMFSMNNILAGPSTR